MKELVNRLMKGIEDWSGPRLAGEGQSCQGNCKALAEQWAGEEGRCWLACDMTINVAVWGQKTDRVFDVTQSQWEATEGF